jgi:integrase
MAGKTSDMLRQQAEVSWQQLQTLLHPDIIHAPRLDWSHVNPRSVCYLVREVQEMPWLNHLALVTAILYSHTKLNPRTVEGRMYGLHARFRVLFPRYQIVSFTDWDPGEHFPRYIDDAELADTLNMRHAFLRDYTAVVHHSIAYLRTLPKAEQNRYQQWIFPALPKDLHRRLSHAGTLLAEQQQRRKEESDAIAPHYARIRGETHLRWNQLKRLRDRYHEVIACVKSGQETLPVTFSYEEPGRGQRLYFRLWDRYTFFENHTDHYLRTTRREYERKTHAFAPERNHFFLEFLHARDIERGTDDRDALLWFGDILRYNLIGSAPKCSTAEERQRRQEYLRSWGYGEEQDEELQTPFRSEIPGLLSWLKGQQDYLREAQKRTQGIIFLIEPLYAAATFGLAALDFFTTTGARNGELIQLSLDADCLYTLEIEGAQRFLVRLVPKGRDTLADYIVSTETQRNLERVGDLLAEHYHLQLGEGIPQVAFNPWNQRAHCFKKLRPYLFQYNRKHFSETAVNACLRFVCHGLVIQTTEGRQIKLKAHLLRHAFATHLHNVEAVPLDVIAVMLHQKNVQVTAYYAAPPWQQVLATANAFLDNFATHLGAIEEAFVRSPAELQRQLEEAKTQVGSLNTVPGGQCTCHAICPIAFACTGCVYNVPDPDREDEIIEQEQWAFIRLEQVKRRGLGPELVKMQALIQRCQVTRQEMQLMKMYRKDESNVPTLTIERDEQRTETAASLAPETLPGETRAHCTPGQSRRRSARQRKANGDD